LACQPNICAVGANAGFYAMPHANLISTEQGVFRCFGKVCVIKPNKSVKGTRRPLAVLKFGFLSRFGGFV